MAMLRAPQRLESDNAALGISAMLISMLLFSVMDATVKWLGGIYPTQQIMFFRCSVALVPVLFALRRRRDSSVDHVSRRAASPCSWDES